MIDGWNEPDFLFSALPVSFYQKVRLALVAFAEGCKFGLPHTIFVQHNSPTEWSFPQKQATALVHCHATLAALAKEIIQRTPYYKPSFGYVCVFWTIQHFFLSFQANVGVLPRPLSIQCVLADRGRHFSFYAYQLNTLDLSTKTGIKNQAWIDTEATTSIDEAEQVIRTEKPYTLFSLADQMEGLMGYQMYREKQSAPRYPIRSLNSYNPEVMKKLLTLYATRLHLGHHDSADSGSPAAARATA